MKSIYSVQNSPSWPDGASGVVNVFNTELTGQNSERQDAVADILSHIGVVASDIKCLLDYNKVLTVDNTQGYYLLDTVDSPDQSIILQVKARIDKQTYELTNQIFTHLGSKGVNTASLIPLPNGDVIDFYKGYAVALTTYTQGHHMDALDRNDMEALGRGVARLDQGMRDLPENLKQSILQNMKDREEIILAGIDFVLNQENQSVIKQSMPSIDVLNLAQSTEVFKSSAKSFCHGDLIDKNAIISEQDGEMVVLDFDGMSYLPDGVDLGMLAFRAGLQGGYMEAQQGADILQSIVKGYNEISEPENEIDIDYLYECIEMAITFKAVFTLGMVEKGMQSDLSAMKRFEAHGKNYQGGMEKLEAIRKVQPQNPNLSISPEI